MTTNATLQQVRTTEQNAVEFKQIPIYIGTAAKKVAVSFKSGSFSLDIPQPDPGFRYISNSLQGSFSYRSIIGNYSVVSVSTDRLSITLSSNNPNQRIPLSDIDKYSVFFVEDGRVIFTTVIKSAIFIADFDIFTFQTIKVDGQVPNLNGNTTIYITRTIELTNYNAVEEDNVITVIVPDENFSIEPFNAPVLSKDLTLSYMIDDFRVITLGSDDNIDNYSDTKHSKIGKLINLHRSLTTMPLSIATVPDESTQSMIKAIEAIDISPSKFGYMIIPTSNMWNYYISDYVEKLASIDQRSFLLNLTWSELPFEKILVQSQVMVET